MLIGRTSCPFRSTNQMGLVSHLTTGPRAVPGLAASAIRVCRDSIGSTTPIKALNGVARLGMLKGEGSGFG
jgi:hypothetical protein